MSVREILLRALAYPTALDLWNLRTAMLEAGIPADAPVWNLLSAYHSFLDQVESCTTSREYSDLASKLDIASISGVILERLFEPQGQREFMVSLLSGALSEGLMVLATRQHVKAWEQGLAAEHRRAAWFLYEELWRWAEEQKPDVAPAARRELLDNLFDGVGATPGSGPDQALLLGGLFQILLAARAAEALQKISR